MKRVVDYPRIYDSAKLAALPNDEYRAEYVWLLGIAGPNGSFEWCERRLWAAAYAPMRDKTLENLSRYLEAFLAAGLLVKWEQDGKTWGYFTGSEKPGRLPRESWRKRFALNGGMAPAPPPELLNRTLCASDARGQCDELTATACTERASGVPLSESESESESELKPSAHPTNEREEGTHISCRNADRLATANLSVFAPAIYHDYPRHIAKQPALVAIAKAIKVIAARDFAGDVNKATEWLKTKVQRYANSPQGKRVKRELIPYPATWFNAAQYDDDESEWKHVSRLDHQRNRKEEDANGNGHKGPITFAEQRRRNLDANFAEAEGILRSAGA